MSKPKDPPSMITTQSAIYFLSNKIQKIEDSIKSNLKQIETKIGEQDNYVSENIPDLDLINNAFRDMNKRLMDLELLDTRVSALEKKLNVETPKKHRGGTIKLQDPVESFGISFTA